jgi:sortase A
MGSPRRTERSGRGRTVAPLIVALLVFAAVGTVVAVDLGSAPDTVASFNADSATTTTLPDTTTTTSTTTSTTTTTTTTTSTTTTTTTTEPLPLQLTQPIAPPQDQRGAENNPLLGRLAIPKIGLDSELHQGIRLTTLDRGPGHWPGTAMPGEIGNVVVAAHRTSHGAEFRHLDALVPGDKVVFTTGDGTFTYLVTGTQIVTPDALWIVNPTDTPTATLFACHPLGSTAKRIVVNLALSN